VDLSRMAGLPPSGEICEIMNDDGTMARMPDLQAFAAEHRLHVVTVADLVRWRMRTERLVTCVLECPFPTAEHGTFQARVYRDTTGALHLALWRGSLSGEPIVTRIQASNGPVDVFRAGPSAGPLRAGLARIAAEDRGVLVYLHIDGATPDALLGRLREQLLGAEPRPQGGDTVLREMGTGAQILVDLGVRELRLLTNTPRKIVGLEGYGIKVVEHLPLG
jgi:3,4-dihydroxy 2-butanone 4-phosphate synthase/GTP cyclohydrolase II